jgi:hypothetical protein
MSIALPFIIHIPTLFLIGILLKKRYKDEPLKRFFWPALLLKLAAGIVLGLLYIFYYQGQGDTFIFDQYANVLSDLFFTNPTEYLKVVFLNYIPETENLQFLFIDPRLIAFSKIVSLLNIISFGSYWITSLYLSLFSFLGTWILANYLVKIFKTSKGATTFAFLFFPSFVFWSSGLMKEAFVIGSICFIVAITLKYIHLKKINFLNAFFVLLITYCSWQIKFYYLLVLLPTLLSYLIICRTGYLPLFNSNLRKMIGFLFIFSLITFLAILIHPTLSIDYLIAALYESYSLMLYTSKTLDKVAYEFYDFRPDVISLLLNSPKALIIGLFRPFVWESPFNFTFLIGMEGLFILILALGKIYHQIKFHIKINLEVTALLTYVSLTAIMMSLISPNWGTLIRYKSAFLPFWILFLCINNPIFLYIETYIANIVQRHTKN